MSEPLPRRTFIGWWTSGLLALIGGLIAVPAMAFVSNPLRRRKNDAGPDFVSAGSLEAIPLNQWKLLPIQITRQDGWAKLQQSRSIWAFRRGPGDRDVLILSPICTHLGCPIALAPDGSDFLCPCHGGIYNLEGQHISGPPPRNMDPLDFDVKNGELFVRWQDFKISTPDRVPVQL